MILLISLINPLFLKHNNLIVTLHCQKTIQFCMINFIFVKKFISEDFQAIVDNCTAFQMKVNFNLTLNYHFYL